MLRTLFILLFLLVGAGFMVHTQPIVGTYEQQTMLAPDEWGYSEHDVVIRRDPQSSKKIWIEHLIPNQRFYAILDTRTEDGMVYAVPKQKVGNYQIELGCIVYDNEEQRVVISLNNKNDCFGMRQSDYDEISVGRSGVKAGNIRVGSDGNVRGGGVDISKNGDIKVDMKSIMAGVSYIGHKQ